MENSNKSKNSDIDPFDLDLTSDSNGFGFVTPVQKEIEPAPAPKKESKPKEKISTPRPFPEKVSKKEIRYASDTQKAVPIDEAVHRKASLIARGLNTSIKSVIQEGINIMYHNHLKEIQDYHKAEQAKLREMMND